MLGIRRFYTSAGMSRLVSNPLRDLSKSVGTGGSILDTGGYRIHTFLSGTSTLTISGPNVNVEYLMLASGGGGGDDVGAGGGAGGYIYGTTTLSAGNYSVVVGAATGSRGQGQNTTFNGLTAIGGGAAGNWSGQAGANGGSAKNSYGLLRQYTKALTQQEILQNYNATKSRFNL